MSAYIVNLDELATLAASVAIVLDGLADEADIIRAANQYGAILHAENVRSVNYRYSDNTSPEVVAVAPEHINAARAWDLGAQLAAEGCLVYQSCETDDWPETVAAKTLARYRSECIAPTCTDDLPHNGGLIGAPVYDGGRDGFIVSVGAAEHKTYTIGASGLEKNSGAVADVVWLPDRGWSNDSDIKPLTFSGSIHSGLYDKWLATAQRYNWPPITPAQAARLLDKYNAEQAARQALSEAARIERDADAEAFKAEFLRQRPAWAVAAIVAEYHESDNDLQSDYHGHRTTKTLILAWSKHTKNNFAEFRKAARNAPETADLADAPKDAEHRENYSMGGGYYLARGYRHSSGWNIGKRTLGENGEPGYIDHRAEFRTTAPAPAKARPEQAPCLQQIPPKLTADTLAVSVRVNTDKNGLEIEFAEKPAVGTREKLKAAGFHWSRRLGYWYAKQTEPALQLAGLFAAAPEGPLH